jgi:acetyl-CoA synthase
LDLTRQSLEAAASQKGKDAKIGFPDTNYYLPLINALLNIEVKTIGDCFSAFAQAESLARGEAHFGGPVIDAMGGLLNKGVSALICEEILAALAVLNREHPFSGTGFIPDKTLRSLGLQLADGRISGVAVIIGPAKDEQAAAELVRDFQSKGIVSLLASSAGGLTFRQQLENKGIIPALENNRGSGHGLSSGSTRWNFSAGPLFRV